jgi:hypothetical protein
MMEVSTLPAPTDPKNCSKCIGGLIFFFSLRVIMDVMLIGTTTLADCANHAARRYLFYAFKCGLPFGEFRNFMHHQQATRYSNYSNAIIWQQCKNARYTLQNEVLPHYNQVGSSVSWREQLKQVLSGLWKQSASPLNVTNSKEGKEKRHNVNQVPAGWMHPHLWGVFSSCIAEGQLNVSGSIVTLSGSDEGDNVGEKSVVNKMQAQCLSCEQSRKRIKSAATTKPKTFTTEDAAGRKAVVANGTRRVASVDAVQCEDGTVGKQGLSTTIINVHGQTRLDMQRQELKTNEWDIILQAKEAGVPGMDEVAAAFVKQHCAYLLDTNN